MTEESKQAVIEQILDRELAMFLTVPVLQKANCQEHPEEFKRTRRAQFLTWSAKTQASYLEDLRQAEAQGRNLMTHKYARMDGLIPPLSSDPLIERIVAIEFEWQQDMFRRCPRLMGGARPLASDEDTPWQTSFETYLAGELETYSSRTLAALYEDIAHALDEGRSLTEELYTHIIKSYGYASLEEAETAAGGNAPS